MRPRAAVPSGSRRIGLGNSGEPEGEEGERGTGTPLRLGGTRMAQKWTDEDLEFLKDDEE